MIRSLTALLLFGLQPSFLTAQLTLGLAAPRRFEIGFLSQWIHRTIRYTDGSSHDPDWARPALFLGLAVTSDLTLEVNGFAWHAGKDAREPGTDYFRSTLGAGLILTPLRRDMWSGGLSMYVHEQAFLDQSFLRSDKHSSQVFIGAHVGRDFVVARQAARIWIGPAYTVDRLWQHPPFEPILRGSSRHNLGAQIGASIIGERRLHVVGEASYLTFWQAVAKVGVLF